MRSRRVRSPTRPDLDPPALLRRALRDALGSIEIITCDWGDIPSVEDAARALERAVTDAIVAFAERDPDGPWIEDRRAAALRAALATSAALGSAYAERIGSPRTVLAACHAVARLIEVLHGAPIAPPRWN